MTEDEDAPPSGAGKPAESDRASLTGPANQQAAAAPGAMDGADFQRYIGRGLRAVFDDVAKQPVPDRFLDLMKKLG